MYLIVFIFIYNKRIKKSNSSLSKITKDTPQKKHAVYLIRNSNGIPQCPISFLWESRLEKGMFFLIPTDLSSNKTNTKKEGWKK